jgi:hypothetical protein
MMMGANTGGQINTGGTTDMLGDLLGTGMTTTNTAPMGGNDLLGAMGGGMPVMDPMGMNTQSNPMDLLGGLGMAPAQ